MKLHVHDGRVVLPANALNPGGTLLIRARFGTVVEGWTTPLDPRPVLGAISDYERRYLLPRPQRPGGTARQRRRTIQRRMQARRRERVAVRIDFGAGTVEAAEVAANVAILWTYWRHMVRSARWPEPSECDLPGREDLPDEPPPGKAEVRGG